MTDYLQLKASNCKDCYKCIRNCPVKAISFSDNLAKIVSDECVLCGRCVVVCPQNAKVVRNDLEQAKGLVHSAYPVYASLAPSFVANYSGATIETMEAALKKLGFAGAEETALGATVVKGIYDGLVRDGKMDVIISSCCHTINNLIQKHYPEAIDCIAPILSPMQAHCKSIKERIPGAKTVFIGPCVSKKEEGDMYPGIVDCVLTFEELSMWFSEEDITPASGTKVGDAGKARWFPTTGGILKSMDCDVKSYDYMAVEGVENCMRALEEIIEGKVSHCFVEMSACEGSCIGGPAMDKMSRSHFSSYQDVSKYAGTTDFEVEKKTASDLAKRIVPIHEKINMPSEMEIRDILKKIGKTRPEHELNCGGCGYNTCREKAIAVYNGKADLSMCLPYLKNKAENFSEHIIRNSPNGILVMDESLQIQQMNDAACKIMKVDRAADMIGEPIVRLLDPRPYMKVLQSKKNSYEEKVYLPEYRKYVEETVIYDQSFHILISMMRDVSDEVDIHNQKKELNRNAIDITDKVIEKQMRVVQEIASLLGETTAETKIALTNLKESLQDE